MAETHYYPTTPDYSNKNKKKSYNHTITNYQFSSSEYPCAQPQISSMPMGGIGIYVRNDLSYQPLPLLNSITSKMISSSQAYWIHVCFPPATHVIIGTVYIRPQAPRRDLNKIKSAITSAMNDYSYPVILTGDFNAYHSDWACGQENHQGTFLSNLTTSLGLDCLNAIYQQGVPTRTTNASSTIIDLSFCNTPSLVRSFTINSPAILTSDHNSISTIISPNRDASHHQPLLPKITYTHSSWNLNKATADDWQLFNDSIHVDLGLLNEKITPEMSNGATSLTQSKLDYIYDEFCSILTLYANIVFGVKNHRKDSKFYYRDPRLIPLIERWHNARKTYQRHNSRINAKLKNATNRHLADMIYQIKNENWESFSDELQDKNNKIVWSIWKRNKGRDHTPLNNIANNAGKLPVSVNESLENLSQYYSSVSSASTASTDDMILDDEIAENLSDNLTRAHLSTDQLSDAEWVIGETRSACKYVKLNTALGPDQIHPLFLRHGSHQLHLFLTQLFNLIWSSGLVPSSWKLANIVSLYKGSGSKTDPVNYRPISLTSVLARMFERMVKPRLMSIIDPKLHTFQFGFRTGRSTYDNLYLSQLFIQSALERKNPLPCAFLDISKAFDKVDHASIMLKLTRMGVKGKLWKFIYSFLTQRLVRCVYDGHASNWYSISASIAQGTVLGPVLFLIYINDLAIAVSAANCVPLLFADDLLIVPSLDISTTAAASPANSHKLRTTLQNALNQCSTWAKRWKMAFGLKKSNVVVFRRNPTKKQQRIQEIQALAGLIDTFTRPFTLSNQPMEFKSSYDYVGVIHQSNGRYNEQGTKLIGKVTKAVHFASRIISKNIHFNIARTLINATVKPLITYGLPFWSPSKQVFTKLNSLLSRPFRRIKGLPLSAHTLSVLADCAIPPVELTRQHELLSYANRINNYTYSNPVKYLFQQHYNMIDPQPPSHPNPLLVHEAKKLESSWNLKHTDEKFNSQAKEKLNLSSYKNWKLSPSGGDFLKSISKDETYSLPIHTQYDNPKMLKLRSRIRHNRALFNERLNKMNPSKYPSPYCSCDFESIENPQHVLIHCPKYVLSRTQLKSALSSCSVPLPSPLHIFTLLALIAGESAKNFVLDTPSFKFNKKHDIEILNLTQTFISLISQTRFF
ncbi:MAG: hypothetical protein H0W89_06995 [Candidatus Levybacteria bacterium]|nr:hypothetical protein [Candidatus Levybacteria bacterium]